MPTRHSAQRVAIFIDVQNMYYSAKNLYDAKVNFKEILKTAVSNRSLVRAFAYVIRADVKDEDHFHTALDNMGIEVKSKDLQTFIGGAKKGDWDIGIAMDAVKIAPKVDTIIIVSGDGDFEDLIIYLKSLGCRVEGIAIGKTSSSKLRNAVDMFFDLESDVNKYFINPKLKDEKKQQQKKKQKIEIEETKEIVKEEEPKKPIPKKSTIKEKANYIMNAILPKQKPPIIGPKNVKLKDINDLLK